MTTLALLLMLLGCAPSRAAVVVAPARPLALRVVVVGDTVVRAGHGALHVEVAPERARVYIDGRYEGRGDQNLVLRAGRHNVRVVMVDGRTGYESFDVAPGRLSRVFIDLK